MNNSQYINAYKKTLQSSSLVTSSHEIVRTLMKELVNSMQKIVLDIQDEMNDNIENDEIEVPDDENIESFDSNIVDSEIKEVNQQIDMHKILLFIGVPLAIIAILYFLVPMIRQRMNGSE